MRSRWSVVLLILLTSISAGFCQQPALDLSEFFPRGKACFLLYDAAKGETLRFGGEQCQKPLPPCSTFKIANSLIALETGVIKDENTVIPWDGTERKRKVLNRDHNLSSAIEHSVVWYYQEVARRVGQERMQLHLDAIGYGNRDISGGLTRFWLSSSLRISADEQMGFLRRLYGGDLPFGEPALATVQRILVLEKRQGAVLSGKTGSGVAENYSLGWFVGRVERNGREVFFVANLESDGDSFGWQVKKKVLKILERLELFAAK